MGGAMRVLSSLQVSHIGMIRKNLPLNIRRTWGFAKRHFSPHNIWGTQVFKNYFHFLEESQWWSLEQLKAYQLEQLKILANFAYEKVPYYQRTFRQRSLHPSDIKTLEDIQKLPLISKKEVKDHIDEFIPIDVDRNKLRLWVTGGSSGVPLSMYLDKFYSAMIEEAFSLRQRIWGGYKQFDRKINLTRVALGNFMAGKCWDYNNNENEIVLKSHDMSEENLFEFLKVIHKFKPLFIVGYPSALEIFARFIKRNCLELPPIKAIFSGSEALFPGQRSLIEGVCRCKIFSGYGMSERVADAIECELHCGYHVNMEYGIFELLDKNCEPIREPGKTGSVVGTGFHNNTMPLIRYQMFDIASYADYVCPCGRKSPLVRDFTGRFREYFVGRSGKLIPLQLVWSGRHPVWSKIHELKFYQEKPGQIVAKIVEAPNYSRETVAKEIQNEARKILTQEEFDIQFEFVESLPLTHRGKLNFLEQKIPLEMEDIEKAQDCQSAGLLTQKNKYNN
jgi:phenylacetate-CoA ligase